MSLWLTYQVELLFTSPLASGTPKRPGDIKAMLEARMPTSVPANAQPLLELGEEIGEEVEASEEVTKGYATFKRDDHGLYFEARCVRAHIKDCASRLQGILGIAALKAKVANRVYVEPPRLYLGKDKPDGTETRIIHVIVRQGPRSGFKDIDYVEDAHLKFSLKVLNDGLINENILQAIFEYGGVHGMGQERSQDFGRYQVAKLALVS